MKYIERVSIMQGNHFRWPLFALLLSVAGCQFIPAPQESEQPVATAEMAVALRSPNPYLIERPDVPSAVKSRFKSALAALAERQWESAETDLLWITENYPQFSGAYLNLALLYQQAGNKDKIEPAFKQAIVANGKNITAYNQYGIYLRSQGRFAEAEQIYLQALAVWPDSPESHLNLGILYDLYMGKLQPALEHYRAYQSLQDEPDRQVQGWIVDTERRLQQAAGG